MYKNKTLVLIIQEWGVAVWSVSKNLTICRLTIVFWANVMNEQWQMNNLMTWNFLFKNPWVDPKKQFA